MRIYQTKRYLQKYLMQVSKGKKIGFVPTMGALHQGHISLIENAKNQTDIVVASIFVNPTQFDKKEDLDHYPSMLKSDLKQLKKNGCDVVFIPTVKEIYTKDVLAQHFDFDGLDQVMEGAHRKGHFDGVGTVVKKLFEIVKPDFAFFGEKDFQQLQIVRKLVAKHTIPVKIVGNPIYREKDGLAMSSRNQRLTKSHKKVAPFIYKTLSQAAQMFQTENPETVVQWVYLAFESQPLLRLEYFSIANEKNLLPILQKEKGASYRGFIAVFAGEIRLIDNLAF